LHHSQPPNPLKQHIVCLLDQLKTNGCLLGNDIVVRLSQATQLYNTGIVIELAYL
jgi:hypothetical protein